jgi:membrane protein required for beta-lactamase induction
MKKGVLFGIAALAVGVVVYTIGAKKVKGGFYPGKAVYKC